MKLSKKLRADSLNTVEIIDSKRLNSVCPIEKYATVLRKFESANSANTVYEIESLTNLANASCQILNTMPSGARVR